MKRGLGELGSSRTRKHYVHGGLDTVVVVEVDVVGVSGLGFGFGSANNGRERAGFRGGFERFVVVVVVVGRTEAVEGLGRENGVLGCV